MPGVPPRLDENKADEAFRELSYNPRHLFVAGIIILSKLGKHYGLEDSGGSRPPQIGEQPAPLVHDWSIRSARPVWQWQSIIMARMIKVRGGFDRAAERIRRPTGFEGLLSHRSETKCWFLCLGRN
jgi:hypothetical protein